MGGKSGGRTSFVKFGIIMMIVLLITNIIMMAALHQHANDTTIILKEFRKVSDVYSGTDLTNRRRADLSRDNELEDGDIVDKEIDNSKGRFQEKQKRIVPKEMKRNDEAIKSKQVEINDKEGFNQIKDLTNELNEKDIEFTINKDIKDIETMIRRLNSSKLESLFPKSFWTQDFRQFVYIAGKRKRASGTILSSVRRTYKSETVPNWRKFHLNIRRYSLYTSRDPAIDGLLNDMVHNRIKSSDDTESGTELKIIVKFEDGGRAVMKPMRYPRDWPVNPNIFVFDDLERHFAEIAAFHLDRLLGFNRVPPTVGRFINVTDFYKVAPKSVKDTYFTSPAGSTCFYGKCDYFCDSGFPFCGSPDLIEVSLMAYLPSRNIADRMSWYQPYKGAYSKWKKAPWEKDHRFCETLKKKYPYNTGKLLLDMIDAHTFDFLNGNPDRHSFAFFKEFGNFSFPILYDNGRGYGVPSYDHNQILAPLSQCCMIRKSTFLKYVKIFTGPEKLSGLMEHSLSTDPVKPVLLREHLEALDRRLVKILKAVSECLSKHSVHDVIIYDGF